MPLLPVDEALATILAGATALPSEIVSLHQSADRILANDLAAKRTQPPFAASAMDGYAVRHDDLGSVSTELTVVGSAGAGHPYDGAIGQGECIRIFTGAPVPDDADTIIIQEDTDRDSESAPVVTILQAAKKGAYVRPAGLDFQTGETLLVQGRALDPAALSLAAAMNHAKVSVVRRPRVAIVATGDELLPPGSRVGAGQIIASNAYGVAALVQKHGGEAIDLGIVRDTDAAHKMAFEEAIKQQADVLVTLGGASVGEHDLVQKVLLAMGAEIGFWRIAMRPGKPLLFGTLPSGEGAMRFLGLPGNPVSSLVCSLIFLQPLITTLAGRAYDAATQTCILGRDLKANDRRQDYLRASLSTNDAGRTTATAFDLQDSSVLSLMARADCLIIRPPNAPAAVAGDCCNILRV